MRSAGLGRTFWSLQITPFVLFTFSITSVLRCYLKFNLLSHLIPKCFWEQVLATGILLKVREGRDVIVRLREKLSL